MECFSPLSIKKHGQDSPAVRELVPCGKCAACLTNRRSEWATRLEHELRASSSAHFITLTYQDPPLGEGDVPSLCKRDLQLFFKRLRKTQKEKIRYYAVGEYGTKTFRPHYHAIIFNLVPRENELLKVLLETWDLGIVHVGEVNSKSIKYTLKYMLQGKQTWYNDYIEKQFATMSKGIGKQYINSHNSWHQKDLQRNYVVKEGGNKARLPRYYREKIYSKHQRQLQSKFYENERFKESELRSESSETFKAEVEYKTSFTKRMQRSLKNNNKL